MPGYLRDLGLLEASLAQPHQSLAYLYKECPYAALDYPARSATATQAL